MPTRATRNVWNALALLAALAVSEPACGSGLEAGKSAPPITLTTLDGKRISTDDLKGHVVILTFWATWCEPCQRELPAISQFLIRHKKANLSVLGFSLDDGDQLDRVRAIAGTLSFPVGLLGDPHVPGYGRVWKLPVNFVIDANGTLIYNGWDDRDPTLTRDRLEKMVTPRLSQETP